MGLPEKRKAPSEHRTHNCMLAKPLAIQLSYGDMPGLPFPVPRVPGVNATKRM